MKLLSNLYGTEVNTADMGDMPVIAHKVTEPTVLKISIKSPVASIIGPYGWTPALDIEVEMPYDLPVDMHDEELFTESDSLGLNYKEHLGKVLQSIAPVEPCDVYDVGLATKLCKEHGLEHLMDSHADAMIAIAMKLFNAENGKDSITKLEFVPAENIGGLEGAASEVARIYKEQYAEMLEQLLGHGRVYFNYSSELLTIDVCIAGSVKGHNSVIRQILNNTSK
ncbi:hypothetical protein [Vibrio phage BONAISHI]|nr:hypothetical protein [Vibrio phage BONAISHI]